MMFIFPCKHKYAYKKFLLGYGPDKVGSCPVLFIFPIEHKDAYEKNFRLELVRGGHQVLLPCVYLHTYL